MKRIEIKFTNGEHLIIKLFDNQLNSDLINEFTSAENMYRIDKIGDSGFQNFYDKLVEIPHIVSDNARAWKIILNSISKLKDLGVKFIREIPSEFDYSQHTLNYLHRVFTYLSMMHQPIFGEDGNINILTSETPEFPFTSDFRLIELSDDLQINFRKLFEIIEPINSEVHELEQFAIPTENLNFTKTMSKLSTLYIRKIEDNSHTPYKAKWYSLLSRDNYHYNYDFMNHTEQNIVCLTDSILGKSVLTSFINDDNPSLPDCTGRFITQGEFIIYPNRSLHELYQSNQFKSWLDKYNMNIDETPLEVAIGHIVESSIPIESFFEISPSDDLQIDTLNWLN